jgi:hypothetical protein
MKKNSYKTENEIGKLIAQSIGTVLAAGSVLFSMWFIVCVLASFNNPF